MRYIYTIAFILFIVFGYGQDSIETAKDTIIIGASDVALETKHYGDKIVLRWAPKDAEWWLYGMLNGYSIWRKDMSDVRNDYEVLVDTIRPWSEEEIENWFLSHPEDEEVAIPLKTMYKDWQNTNYKEANFADIYERSTYFNQRHNMTILAADMFPIVADAAGLRWEDTSIDKDKFYAYKITFNKSDAKQGAYSIAKKWQLLEKPIIFEAKEKEERIVITWDRRLHDQMYTAYHIERSLDNVTYERITNNPYVQAIGEGLATGRFISYMDRVENYQMYYYRLIGIDPFGDESMPSEAVFAQGKDRTPPVVNRPDPTLSEAGDANLVKWSHEPIEEISQVIIYKEDPIDKDKIVYQSTKEAGFNFEVEDTDVNDGMSMYYVVLVDTAGNYAQSVAGESYKQDKTPPLPPTNLKAKPDTTGRVILSWDQGPDLDVIGYYVFTAPRKNDNYLKLNQKKHLFRIYEDSINMTLLTDKRYYKVAAIDKGGNIGDYSEILEVNLPDKIPPAPCLFYDYRVDSAGVFLGLMPSSSIDVVAHKLYRKQQGASEWKLIKEFGKQPPQVYQDNNLISGGSYIYKWIAEDEGGLQSSDEHSKLNVTAFDSRVFYRPMLRLTKTDDGVKIEVSKNIPGENYRIQLIRSYKGGKYRTLTTLKDKLEYLDKANIKVDEKLEVKYRAKVLYKDGKRSKFGPEVSL